MVESQVDVLAVFDGIGLDDLERVAEGPVSAELDVALARDVARTLATRS